MINKKAVTNYVNRKIEELQIKRGLLYTSLEVHNYSSFEEMCGIDEEISEITKEISSLMALRYVFLKNLKGDQ